MKKFKQILMLIITFGMGVIVGNVIELGVDLDSLSSLYNLTDYFDIVYGFFIE